MGCFDLLICKSMAAGRQPEMYCAVEKVGDLVRISQKVKANSSVCRLPVSFRQKGLDASTELTEQNYMTAFKTEAKLKVAFCWIAI